MKLHRFQSSDGLTVQLLFQCPGCGYAHPFTIDSPTGPRWTWNESLDEPTFSPSLLINVNNPSRRCHLYLTRGELQFLPDSWHALRGQKVPLPDWDVEGRQL